MSAASLKTSCPRAIHLLQLLSPEPQSGLWASPGWPWWWWACVLLMPPLLLLGQQSLLSEALPDVGACSLPDATRASTLQAREQ